MAIKSQKCIRKTLGMYHGSKSARISERIENAKLVKELADEKNKITRSTQVS
jgi:hypothetical protein